MSDLESIKIFCETIIDENLREQLDFNLQYINKLKQDNKNVCTDVVFIRGEGKRMEPVSIKYRYLRGSKKKVRIKAFLHNVWIGFGKHSYWYADDQNHTDVEECTIEISSNNLVGYCERYKELSIGPLKRLDYKELDHHIKQYFISKIYKFFRNNGFEICGLPKHTF